jgi:hypothetical protein
LVNVLAVALVLALQGSPSAVAPPWYGWAGRVYTSARLHVGVRPAVLVDPDERAVGLTIQLTTFLP